MKTLSLLLVPFFVACSGNSGDTKEEKNSKEDVSTDTEVVIKSKEVDQVFKCSFLEADKITPVNEITTNRDFYLKIDYPKGFERTTFNLHQLDLTDNSGLTFQSLMIPYAELEEIDNGVLVKLNVPRDENYELNVESFTSIYNSENGKMKIHAVLQNTSQYLLCESDTIIFDL